MVGISGGSLGSFTPGFQNSFKIEQRKEELKRALHIFIPFNSSDAISDTPVSFPGFFLLALHISFVMQPLLNLQD